MSLTPPRSAFSYAVDYLFPELTPERQAIEADYETWLSAMYPTWASEPLAEHHHVMWR